MNDCLHQGTSEAVARTPYATTSTAVLAAIMQQFPPSSRESIVTWQSNARAGYCPKYVSREALDAFWHCWWKTTIELYRAVCLLNAQIYAVLRHSQGLRAYCIVNSGGSFVSAVLELFNAHSPFARDPRVSIVGMDCCHWSMASTLYRVPKYPPMLPYLVYVYDKFLQLSNDVASLLAVIFPDLQGHESETVMELLIANDSVMYIQDVVNTATDEQAKALLSKMRQNDRARKELRKTQSWFKSLSREEQSNFLRECGRRGGLTTLERYGLDHYRELGKKGGKKGGPTILRRGIGIYGQTREQMQDAAAMANVAIKFDTALNTLVVSRLLRLMLLES